MRFIGITGGVGAGKSELLAFIGQHYQCEIYLADEVAGKLREPGGACYERLVALLGREVLLPDGQIDKAKMAARIFADEHLYAQVNALIHPAVQEYLLARRRDAKSRGDVELFFVEAALLIECGYRDLVDEMWYIYADEGTRRQRLRAARGYDEARIDGIMASQLPEEEFRAGADFVIDNSGALAESFKQIRKRLEAYTWRE